MTTKSVAPRTEIEEKLRAMMKRLAALGRPFIHTVWELPRETGGCNGFLIHRSNFDSRTPVVVWLHGTSDDLLLSYVYRKGAGSMAASGVALTDENLSRLEIAFQSAIADSL